MVRYIKDGAYTIKVDDEVASQQDGSTSGTADGSAVHELQAEEEVTKEIDYTSTAFILQNLQLAVPNYGGDKTYMLSGRKDLVEVICSQICFYTYCALLGLEAKTNPVSILIMGDGFLGANVIRTFVKRGFTSMLRLFVRSETSAIEWSMQGIKADCNVMQLLGGQRPDIIIPCVQHASFTAICKQLGELSIVTESTFIITPTFGFQRRKLLHNLKCSNIFRTFVEPQRSVRKFKSTTLARRMELLGLLSEGLGGLRDDSDPEDEAPVVTLPEEVDIGGGRKERGLAKSVMWGGDVEDPLDEATALGTAVNSSKLSHAVIAAQKNLTNLLDSRGPMTPSEEGAAVLKSRLHGAEHLLQLLENFYFIHGMLHHEARQTAMSVLFGYHEARFRALRHEDGAALPADEAQSGPGSPGSPTASHVSHTVSFTDLHSAHSNHSTTSNSIASGAVKSVPTAGLSASPMHSQTSFGTHQSHPASAQHYVHRHHIYKHNVLRRSKVPNRVRAVLEQAIDSLYDSEGRVYQSELAFDLGGAELEALLQHYPPNHQTLLDQASFQAARQSLEALSADTPGSRPPLHHVPKADKHSKFMYSAEAVQALFALDDDYEDMFGPGFDFMRRMDEGARPQTPKSRATTANSGTSGSSASSASPTRPGTTTSEGGDGLKDLESMRRQMQDASRRMTAEAAPREKESMGSRIFRKHSMYSKDLNTKLTTEILLDDSRGGPSLLDDQDFTQAMSSAAALGLKKLAARDSPASTRKLSFVPPSMATLERNNKALAETGAPK